MLRIVRLFLASTDPGPSGADDGLIAALSALCRDQRRTAIIVAAREDDAGFTAETAFETERARLGELGTGATLLDPRSDDAAVRLAAAEVLWVSGGSLHALRAALRCGRLSRVLGARVRAGALVYAGASAGAIAAGPALYGPAMRLRAWRRSATPLWGELGLIETSVVPHHPLPGAPADEFSTIADHLRARGCRCETICDGEALICAEGTLRRVGVPAKASPGPSVG